MNADATVGERFPDGRIVYCLESRKSLDLSLADIMPGGAIQVFPYVEEKGLLFLQFRRRRLVISAGPFIGLIPLTPQISIEVRPKLPVTNIARILDSAQRSLSLIPGTERLYLKDGLESDSILEFLALNLCEAFRPVLEGGFLKAYTPKLNLSSQPKGKIDVVGTLRAWGRGQRHFLSATRHEQTPDIPCNRVLKAAMLIVLRRLVPTTEGRKSLISVVNKNYLRFPSTVGDLRPQDRSIVRNQIAKKELPPSRYYYYRALEIALMLLTDVGVSLQSAGADVSLSSFIINFEDLFEEYLRRVLYVLAPDGVLVRDGNKDGKRFLFDEGRGQMAQPDIVINAAGHAVVVEVKYKEKPNRDDINQAVAYALCYRTDRVVLVHQKPLDRAAGLYRIGEINGIKLEAYAFDLGACDLEREEHCFAQAIFSQIEELQAYPGAHV